MKQLSKTIALKALLLVGLLLGAVTGAWADEVTYTFTTRDWNATLNGEAANWTNNKTGAGFSNNGIQVTTNYTGASGTTPEEYANITKIVATYNTNKSAGAGTIVAKVGNNTAKTNNWAYSSGDGRTSNYTTEFNYDTPQSGSVTITLNTTTNSIYLVSIAITYGSGATPTCSAPVFTPAAGTVASGTQVTLSCATEGASIVYLIGDGDPDADGTDYTGPITVDKDMKIQAFAFKDGYESSSVVSATYTILTLEHEGTVDDPYTVADARAAIDASVGTTDVCATGIVSEIVTAYNTQYSNISFNFVDNNGDTNTLQAYRCKGTDGVSAADVQVGDIVVVKGDLKKYNSTYEFAEGCFLISLTHPAGTVEKPTFSIPGGTYTAAQSVTLYCETSGTTIYYTTDGSEPTSQSTEYIGPITVDKTTTIKAIAVKGDKSSAVATETYYFCSADNPYTVTQALAFSEYQYPANGIYVSGIVSTAPTQAPTTDGQLTYYISDDGSEKSDQLEVYKGLGLNGAAFTAQNDIQLGDVVTIYGNVKIYNQIKEFDTNNQIVVFNRPDPASITLAKYEYTMDAKQGGGELPVTCTNLATDPQLAVVFVEADGVTPKTYDWISATINANGNIDGQITANTGEARTAYFYVTGVDASGNTVKSNLVTFTQEAPVTDPTITVNTTEWEVEYTGGSKTFGFDYANLGDNPTFQIQYFASDGTTETQCGWITSQFNNDKVTMTVQTNDETSERIAYFKVYAEVNKTKVYSNLVTITQQVNNSTPTPSGDQFVKVTSTNDLEDGDYLIVYEDGSLAFNGGLNPLDAASNTISVTIKDGAIAKTTENSAALFTITKDKEAYIIKSASGKYIGQITDANGLKESETDVYTNTISFADGNADIVGTGGAYLRYNATSGQERFRYYKSATYSSQKAIALFKYVGTPDTRLDPELSYLTTSYNINFGDQFEAPALQNPHNLTGITYSSSDPQALDLDDETGEIGVIRKAGTFTITASFAGNDDYKKGSASYTLTVTDTRIATTTTQENIVLNIADIASLTRLAPVVKDAEGNDVSYTNSPTAEGLPDVYFEIVSDDDKMFGSFDSHGNIVLNSAAGTAIIKAVFNYFQTITGYQPSECTFTITVVDPNAPGGQKNPYTVADAITYINGLNGATSPADVYVSGIVSQAPTAAPTSDGQLTYFISDDGTTTTQLQVYKGLGLDGAAFTAQDDIQVGDEVTVVGKVKLYGKTPEFDAGNRLYAFNRPAPQSFAVNWNTDENVTLYVFGTDLSEALENGDEVTSGTTVMISPDYVQGYVKDELTVVDAAGNNINLNASDESGAWTFTMPKSEVTITATSKVAPQTTQYNLAKAITSGKHYIITNVDNKVMGHYPEKGNNCPAVTVSIADGVASVAEDAGAAEVVICGSAAEGYTIYTAEGYLYAASSSANQLKSKTPVDANGLWSIDIDASSGVATIKALGSNTRNWMRYNKSSDLFSCYASGQNDIYLYERDGEVAPEPDYNRNVTAGNWGTICLPNTATVIGAELYSIAGVDNKDNPKTLYLSEVKGTAEAGKPYLFKAKDSAITAYYSVVAVPEALNENGLYGSLTGQAVDEGMYLLSGGQIVKCGTGCSIGANRAYINMSEVVKYSGSGEAGVKAFTIGGGEVDGIDGINDNVNASTIYDLTGRRVSHARKGLYIVNGKKVSVK